MRRIKGRSSRKIFEMFPNIKKKYWGRHFWARGYLCNLWEHMTAEMIENYLSSL